MAADELLRGARHQAAVARMLEQGGGAIVSIASVNAFFQPDGGTITTARQGGAGQLHRAVGGTRP